MERQEGVMVVGEMMSEQKVRRMRRKKVMVQRMMRNGLMGKGKCEIILRTQRQ